MSVTLDLRPEVEARLQAQAAARGVSLQEFLESLVESQVATPSAPGTQDDKWERDFEALIDSFPQEPVLSDDAIGRNSIYTREDDL